MRSPLSTHSPRGFVLVAILVLVMLISMIAISLLFRLRAEETAASASAGSEQAWSVAMSGVQEAMRIAAAATPGSDDWQDKPGAFRSRFVFEDGSDQWFFTVWSPAFIDSLAEIRYGLTDEASKLNLNHTDATNITRLPNLPQALITSLRGGADTNTTSFQEVPSVSDPSSISSSNTVQQATFATVDELLRVPGFSPALLYGEDANQNWQLDLNENDGEDRFPSDNTDGKLDLGLRQYLTVVSSEPNEYSRGIPKTDINDPLHALPAMELPPALTNFIAALRANKLQIAHPADLLEATIKVKDGKGAEVEVPSGVGKEELPKVLELFTTTHEDRQHGLININTAGVPVLATIPGIDETLAESILSTRRSIGPERRTTIAWLYQESVVDAALFKRIAPHLTARSYQYSFHVVGYGLPSGRFRALDVIIDLSGGEPRVSYLRDLTRLGIPFALEAERTEAPVAQAAAQGFPKLASSQSSKAGNHSTIRRQLAKRNITSNLPSLRRFNPTDNRGPEVPRG
ncbi:MAG: hypothetical protein EXS31_00345 [Pedosphaera sp.]|nr:hypothetical protein [Pedosphaera sp.]